MTEIFHDEVFPFLFLVLELDVHFTWRDLALQASHKVSTQQTHMPWWTVWVWNSVSKRLMILQAPGFSLTQFLGCMVS